MHLEGSRLVKADNDTAFSYFKKSADKVSCLVMLLLVVRWQ